MHNKHYYTLFVNTRSKSYIYVKYKFLLHSSIDVIGIFNSNNACVVSIHKLIHNLSI